MMEMTWRQKMKLNAGVLRLSRDYHQRGGAYTKYIVPNIAYQHLIRLRKHV